MNRIQLISVAVSLLFLVQVLWFTSRRRFRERQAFLWIVLAFSGVVIAGCLPLLNRAAVRIGVAYMPALVFTLAFVVILSLLMIHTAALSAQQEKLKTLIQELAYLHKEIEDMRQERKAEEKHDVSP